MAAKDSTRKLTQPKQREELHVYASRCAWSGPISAVGLLDTGDIQIAGKTVRNSGLPCCPYCKSVLFQCDESEWWRGAQEHDLKGHMNYVEFLKWKEAQPRCWQAMEDAAVAFTEATGKPVTLKL